MRWTDIEDIVEALEDSHPDTDIKRIRFTALHKMVVELLGFDDDPKRSNERILEAIQGAWIELRDEE